MQKNVEVSDIEHTKIKKINIFCSNSTVFIIFVNK